MQLILRHVKVSNLHIATSPITPFVVELKVTNVTSEEFGSVAATLLQLFRTDKYVSIIIEDAKPEQS